MIENRKSYRLPFRAKLIFSDGLDVGVGSLINLSKGGLFVATQDTPHVDREREYRCVFNMDGVGAVSMLGKPKRIVAISVNPEILPGVGFSFLTTPPEDLKKIESFVATRREHIETALAILSSGDPDWSTLEPVLGKLQLPPGQDLSELRTYLARIMKSIEMVDQNHRPERP